MYSRIIINSLSIIFLAMVQIGLVQALPGWLAGLNIILVVIIFISGLSGIVYAWWWAIGAGLILDTFSFMPFGVYLTSLALTVLVINYLWLGFFTNRSIYSFMSLTFFAFIIYKSVLYTSAAIINLVLAQGNLMDISLIFWKNEFFSLVANLLLVILIYYIFTFASKSLRPVFLLRTNTKK